MTRGCMDAYAVLPPEFTTGQTAYTSKNKVVMALATMATYAAGFKYTLKKEQQRQEARVHAAALKSVAQKKSPATGEPAAPEPCHPGNRRSMLESLPESLAEIQTDPYMTCPFVSRVIGHWIG